jgi:hypothetical protein
MTTKTMTLAEVTSTLVAATSGATSVADAARALGIGGDRLGVYVASAQRIRQRAIAGMFPHVRAMLDDRRWSALVDGYFGAHALRSFELGPDFSAFAGFVRERTASDGLPAWLSDLADFEFHEWIAPRRPRSADDERPDEGPLRVTSTMFLRDYHYDLVRFIDDHAREGEPEARACTCVFWQDRNAESLRNVIEAVERSALLHPESAPKRILDALRAADLVLGAG